MTCPLFRQIIRLFSARGVSFPVGKRFRHSGLRRALISDPDYGWVGGVGGPRSLTLLEALAFQGGSLVTFTTLMAISAKLH